MTSFDFFLIPAILFSVGYLFLVIWFMWGWVKLPVFEYRSKLSKKGITIIVPVRNEENTIADCLNSLLLQNYPKELLEIIVVNDFSTDNTLSVLKSFESKGIQVLEMKHYLGDKGEKTPNKKKAIAIGVKNATNEIIVTTDGDCFYGVNWVSSLVEGFTENNYSLASSAVIISSSGSPLSMFQQLDLLNMAAITASSHYHQSPLMSNGANLIFSKNAFHEVQGFKGNEDIPTGDDYFLMKKLNDSGKHKTGFIKCYDSIVNTKAEKSLSGFFEQRTRWVSKFSGFSSKKAQLILGFAYLFNLFLIFTAIISFRKAELAWLPFVVMFGTKLFIDFIFNCTILYYFKKLLLLFAFPVVNVLHVLYTVIIGLSSTGEQYYWKGRKITRNH